MPDSIETLGSFNAETPGLRPTRAATSEVSTLIMLSVGFTLVGLDRFILGPLFPAIAKDLQLNYQDLGLISGALALAVGLASVFAGQLSDRWGNKRVLLPALIAFSLMAACSGLATGLASLLILRGLMGLSEGAFMPAGITAVAQASKSSRVGLNIGITQMAMGLGAQGLGPIIATQFLKFMSWQWIYAVVSLPGFILAYFIYARFHAPRQQAAAPAEEARMPLAQVLRLPQVWAVLVAAVCWYSSLIVMAAFLPTYLTDGLKLGLDTMGMVLSGAGIGAVVGMVVIPWLSDRFGRKPVMAVALVFLAGVLWMLMHAPADPGRLFALVLLAYLFNTGVLAVGIGPLAGESVPPAYASTATGLVLGAGEIVGGAVVPAVTGGLARPTASPSSSWSAWRRPWRAWWP